MGSAGDRLSLRKPLAPVDMHSAHDKESQGGTGGSPRPLSNSEWRTILTYLLKHWDWKPELWPPNFTDGETVYLQA